MKSTSLYSPEPPRGWLPWGAFAPFLCLVLVALPNLAASLALRPFNLASPKGDPIGAAGFAAFLLSTFTLMGLVILGWVRFVEKRPLATIGFVGSRRARRFLSGIAIGTATISIVVAAIWVAGGFTAGGYGPAFRSRRALLGIAALLPCFALQSSVEEFVFRGWLLSAIARKFDVALAVLLTSATFTLLHFDRGQHWATTTAAFLFSAFACTWALRSGSIWGVMGWHAGWNWLLAVGFELRVTGLSTGLPALLVKLNPVGSVLMTGGAQGPEGSLWCNLFFIVAIPVLLLLPQRPVPEPRRLTPTVVASVVQIPR